MSVLTPAHFDWATLTAGRAMRRYALKLNQRKFLDFLLLNSFDLGHTRAQFKSYNEIVDGTGIHKTNISGKDGILVELRTANVIEVSPWPPIEGRDFSGLYGVNILFDNWRLPLSAKYLRAQQRLLDLKYPDELRDAILENFVECGASRTLQALPVSTGASPAYGHTAPDRDVNLSAEPRDSRDVGRGGNSPTHYFSPEAGRPAGGVPSPVPSVSKIPTVATGAFPASVGNLPTVCQIPAENRPRQGVGDLPTVFTNAAAVSPQTPLVQKRRETEDKDTTTETAKGLSGGVQRGGQRRPVSQARAAGLYRELEEFFAKPTADTWQREMDRSAEGFWKPKVIHNFPDALEAALAEAKGLDKENYAWDWKPAWLVAKVGKLAHVKSWPRIRPGPAPRD